MIDRLFTYRSSYLLTLCLIALVCGVLSISLTVEGSLSPPSSSLGPLMGGSPAEKLALFGNSTGITASGLSSGAFFTVQLSIAYSRLISGFASLAGGPYNAGQGNIAVAVAVMENPLLVNLPLIYTQMMTFASTGMIDPVDHVRHQQAYIFAGSKDSTVHPDHGYLLKDMYSHLGVPSQQLHLARDTPSEHAFVTDNPAHNPCGYKGEPYINYCGYSTIYHVLNHLYPTVAPPSSLLNSTHLYPIDQWLFVPPSYSPWASQLGIHRRGYIYIPAQCENSITNHDLFSLMLYNDGRAQHTMNDPAAQREFDALRSRIWRQSVLNEFLTHHNGTSVVNGNGSGDGDRLIAPGQSSSSSPSSSPSFESSVNDLFYSPVWLQKELGSTTTPQQHQQHQQHQQKNAQCKIHLAFHGCKQTQDHLGQDYMFQTGYMNYAEHNNLVVIFPQAAITPLNPNGCFDWWGYSGLNYSTKYGAQPMTYMNLATSLQSFYV